MRERLDAMADKLVKIMACDALGYNTYRIACSGKSILTDYDYEVLGEALRLADDDETVLDIGASIRIIFCSLYAIPITKLLLAYQRHKLRKIQKAEEA